MNKIKELSNKELIVAIEDVQNYVNTGKPKDGIYRQLVDICSSLYGFSEETAIRSVCVSLYEEMFLRFKQSNKKDYTND